MQIQGGFCGVVICPASSHSGHRHEERDTAYPSFVRLNGVVLNDVARNGVVDLLTGQESPLTAKDSQNADGIAVDGKEDAKHVRPSPEQVLPKHDVRLCVLRRQ
jgi:hypothetical protein